jgi:hypothetical protein
MSLISYKDARPWAKSIREAVLSGKMPPWGADAAFGHFANDPRLSKEETAILSAWVAGGAPEGDPKNLPAPPDFSDDWKVGTPDAVFEMPEEYTVAATGPDEYNYFVIPTHFKEDVWVQAAQVIPGNRRVVHHLTAHLRVPAKPKPAAKAESGWSKWTFTEGKLQHIRPELPVVNDGCASPGGGYWPGSRPGESTVLAVYLPGRQPEVRPPGYAVRIPAGASIVFQTHYSRTGKLEKDRSRIGLVFAKGPVEKEIHRVEIWNMLFRIPPGAPNHEVTSCYTFDRDVMAISYSPHMHFRGKDARFEAVFPDGRRETLLSVPKYSFLWQMLYTLAKPQFLPRGTKIVTTMHFDNSANNPLNPDPSKAIRWGEPSYEEMAGTWIEWVTPALASASSE